MFQPVSSTIVFERYYSHPPNTTYAGTLQLANLELESLLPTTPEMLAVLEKTVISDRDSYNGGCTLRYQLRSDVQNELESLIQDFFRTKVTQAGRS
jgi:hypothetical protein